MPAIKYILRLQKIDKLIRLKSTGSPNELAEKLNIPKRQVFNYIKDLKELGAPIEFNNLIAACIFIYTNSK